MRYITAPAGIDTPIQKYGDKPGAADGITGRVADFMMDDKIWTVVQLVIRIGHRLTGDEVRIPPSHMPRISYEDSMVFVNLTKEVVGQNPAHHLVPPNAAP